MSQQILVACPFCNTAGFTERGLRNHYCAKLDRSKIHKQDWWVAIDKARVAAGQLEMTYGFIVKFERSDLSAGTVHGAGVKSAVIWKARLSSLYKKVLSIEPLTYAQYCNAYGIPGSKM